MADGARFSMLVTPIDGDIISAANWIGEFQNILNNLDPSGLGSGYEDTTEMQATSDPYPGASASVPVSLKIFLQQITYLIKQITGQAQWYIDPVAVISKDNGDTPYTASWGEEIEADTSGGVLTINLPTYVGNAGKVINIKLVTAGNILTVDGNGAETIQLLGAATATVTTTFQGDSFQLKAGLTNVIVV